MRPRKQSQAFAETWQALPPFEASSIVALRTLDRFSTVANPYLEEFRPVERQLTSLLQAAKPFAPQFDSFLTALGPADGGRQEGPSVHRQRPQPHRPACLKTSGRCCTTSTRSCSRSANTCPSCRRSSPTSPPPPRLTAATAARCGQGPTEHYLRTMLVFNPESLAVYPQRVGTNRANPYFQPGAFRALGNGGLQVFSNSACANSAPSVSGPANEAVSQSLIELIHQFKVANDAGKPQRSRGARLQPAGSVHVQRQDQPVPACHLRRKRMSEEPGPTDEYQYHSGGPDLAGDPDPRRSWSIRCIDVHKRLGGVPVLNGLNVAFPDETITVVLGPRAPARAC